MASSGNQSQKNTFKEKPRVADVPQKAKKTASKPKASKAKKTRKPFVDSAFVKVLGGLLIFFAFWLFLALISYLVSGYYDSGINTGNKSGFVSILENITGSVGTFLSGILIKESFGIGAFFVVVLLFYLGVLFVSKRKILKAWDIWKYSLISFVWLPLFLSLFFSSTKTPDFVGTIGTQLNVLLSHYIGIVGVVILVFFSFAIYVIYNFKLTFKLPERFKKKDKKNIGIADERTDLYNTVEFAVDDNDSEDFSMQNNWKNTTTDDVSFEIENPNSVKNNAINKIELEVEATDEFEPELDEEDSVELVVEQAKEEKIVEKTGAIEHFGLDTEFDPTLELRDFQFPPLSLLNDYGDDAANVEVAELEVNKNRIVETLKNYAINIDKIKATIGPSVTLYEIVPAPGIRISKIKNLEDDIALSLSAMGIRIIAPIPGKGTVGIEVPNQKPKIVSMRSILGSEQFVNTKYELPFALGKTIANESFVADLTKMPHILMAGATGQGKSVGLNAIIASLLYCKHPAELKFVMVDPKKVELSLFSRIERHYLAKLPDSEDAIITDTRKVVRTLNSLCIEMDNRYELLKDAQVRNIKEYNTKFKARKLNPQTGHRFLPYIVLVVDEFADLIMTAGKEVENPITRLAQLARAIGIHLIIATQRPSVNIITGTIKANFPARIAFRVISRIDSRTILDASGADQLIGRGDMLLSTGNDMIRLQCAFVDTPEIEAVTDFIGSQRAYPDAYHLPEYADEQDEPQESFDASDRDSLFEDAARIIVQTQQGSTSLLQRKLKLGYNRAGRIIDQLEAAGIVGPFEGSKAREVKVANEMALEQFLKDLDSRNGSSNNEF
jgi:S-DNA-T family DNA segregation ATPase FtsK/SpoIIIE